MLRRRTRASAILAQRFPTCVRIPTYPVRRPQLSLDRIYLSPQWEVADARVLDHGAALQASDHLPLVAEVRTAASHDLPIWMRPVGSASCGERVLRSVLISGVPV